MTYGKLRFRTKCLAQVLTDGKGLCLSSSPHYEALLIRKLSIALEDRKSREWERKRKARVPEANITILSRA